jgi:hypothetical protein
MDKISKQLFDELVSKAPHELRPSDLDFLRARESYLTPDQRELFATVLHAETKPEKKAK